MDEVNRAMENGSPSPQPSSRIPEWAGSRVATASASATPIARLQSVRFTRALVNAGHRVVGFDSLRRFLPAFAQIAWARRSFL
jgi:hypothetical protein